MLSETAIGAKTPALLREYEAAEPLTLVDERFHLHQSQISPAQIAMPGLLDRRTSPTLGFSLEMPATAAPSLRTYRDRSPKPVRNR